MLTHAEKMEEAERLKRYHPQLKSLWEVQAERDEDEYENRCEVYEDGPCQKEATCRVEEPYTPGRFTLPMCDEHAEGAIYMGYKLVK
jgi:hypothetical protein